MACATIDRRSFLSFLFSCNDLCLTGVVFNGESMAGGLKANANRLTIFIGTKSNG